MKLNVIRILFFVLGIGLFTESITASGLKAVRSGEWNDPTVWDQGRVPTIDDDVLIDNLNKVVYSLAEVDMQESVRLCRNLYIDIDSELSLGTKTTKQKLNLLIGGTLTCQGEITVGDGNVQGAYITFNAKKSGIAGSGKAIVSNINVTSDQAQFVVSISQLTVSNNVQMGAKGGSIVFAPESQVNIGMNLSTAGHAGQMNSWGRIVVEGEVTCGKLFLCNSYTGTEKSTIIVKQAGNLNVTHGISLIPQVRKVRKTQGSGVVFTVEKGGRFYRQDGILNPLIYTQSSHRMYDKNLEVVYRKGSVVDFIQQQNNKLLLASVFTDNMVLQRNCVNKIWGYGVPGTTVDVNAAWGAKNSAVVGSDGKWITQLTTPELGMKETILTVSSGNETIRIEHILLGDIWLCSGQSNMTVTLANVTAEGKTVDLSSPALRYFSVPNGGSTKPQETFVAEWENPTMNMSALSYYFGMGLVEHLSDTPIGLIHVSMGSSSNESFIDEESLKSMPFYYREIPAMKDGTHHERLVQKRPCTLYNQLIHPLLNLQIKGVIWHQGGGNVPEYQRYRTVLPLMIDSWRKLFKQDIPFYYIQMEGLALRKDAYCYAQETQALVQAYPNCYMVTAYDLGEPYQYHPKDKKSLGDRLSTMALVKSYGLQIPVYSGPSYDYYTVEDNKMILHFKGGLGSGLMLRKASAVTQEVSFSPFLLSGDGKEFYSAKAVLRADKTVELSSPEITVPVAARYCFVNYAPEIPLSNKEGYPCLPFRTDGPKVCKILRTVAINNNVSVELNCKATLEKENFVIASPAGEQIEVTACRTDNAQKKYELSCAVNLLPGATLYILSENYSSLAPVVLNQSH